MLISVHREWYCRAKLYPIVIISTDTGCLFDLKLTTHVESVSLIGDILRGFCQCFHSGFEYSSECVVGQSC